MFILIGIIECINPIKIFTWKNIDPLLEGDSLEILVEWVVFESKKLLIP